jgi:DNA-binding response OmpR family regulator
MRILLVEDEHKVASFVAHAVWEDPHVIDAAETGELLPAMAT